MKLTKRTVDAISYEATGNKRDVHWDDSLPGFGVRVYPTGRKAFVLSYRVNGRKRLMTIGSYGVLTLDQARKQAKRYLAKKDEEDPLEKRRKERQGETVKELCEAYLERYAKERKKSWRDDERRINKRIMPAWGNVKAANIKNADVAALHNKVGKEHPYEANRLVELVSKMFELAQKWGFVPNDSRNPAQGIDHYKEEKRDRWVTPEELPKLTEAIDEDENIYARYALWLYLLTGVRKSELLNARWDDIDWDRKELCIPQTKAGRKHYVPLSEAALVTLRAIPRLAENPYVLPGLKPSSRMVNIDKPWRRVRDRATVKLWAAHPDKRVSALITQLTETIKRSPTCLEVRARANFDLPPGVEDVRLHDLRRTVGSWLAQSGNSLHLIGRVLNHSNASTTAIYARFGEDQVRAALERHGEQIIGTAKKKPSA